MRPTVLAAWLAVVAGCALRAPPSPAPRQGTGAGEAPLVAGNDLRLLVDGPQTHGAMFDAMARARDHINVETYILDDGEIGERFAGLLARKAAQGVKVNLIYDAIGSIGTAPDYFERLKKAGVHICEFNPVNPARGARGSDLNNRDHRKIAVVDGRVAFTGGINISEAYAYGSARARRNAKRDEREDAKRGWRDTDVRVEGPVTRQFQRLFLDSWALQDCGPIVPARYFPALAARGDKSARVVASDPVRGESEMYVALLAAIRQARQRVWLTIGYFVPDPATREALEQAARRGVDVRLVLPGFSDFWAPVYAGRSSYEELLAAGVRIYEWHQALMHAKTALVDSDWASVGSTNVDWRSFVHNYEADLIVRDAAFAAEMERRFLLDVQASGEVTREKWASRGPLERLKEALARAWQYML